jgi:hypothetical protein
MFYELGKFIDAKLDPEINREALILEDRLNIRYRRYPYKLKDTQENKLALLKRAIMMNSSSAVLTMVRVLKREDTDPVYAPSLHALFYEENDPLDLYHENAHGYINEHPKMRAYSNRALLNTMKSCVPFTGATNQEKERNLHIDIADEGLAQVMMIMTAVKGTEEERRMAEIARNGMLADYFNPGPIEPDMDYLSYQFQEVLIEAEMRRTAPEVVQVTDPYAKYCIGYWHMSRRMDGLLAQGLSIPSAINSILNNLPKSVEEFKP